MADVIKIRIAKQKTNENYLILIEVPHGFSSELIDLEIVSLTISLIIVLYMHLQVKLGF